MGDGNTVFTDDTCYVYAQEGDYIITQFALDQCGGLDTLKIPVSILTLPDITLSSVNPICLGDTIAFESFLSGDVTEVLWDFGDGNNSTEQNPIHVYQAPGEYTVTASAFSFENCAVNRSILVRVNDLLEVSLSMPDSICAGEAVLLENTTIGASFSCLWLVDGTGAFSTCDVLTSFTTDGLTPISLTLTDNTNGCESQLDTTIFIRATPSTDFDILLLDPCTPNFFRFFNRSVNANTAHWDFGDGTNSSALDSVEHEYVQPGIYEITLISSVDGICFDTMRNSVDVPESLESIIELGDNDGCEPFAPELINLSAGTNLTFEWMTSTGLNFFGAGFTPSFSTNIPSEAITIQLIIRDSVSKCGDTSDVEIFVYDNPKLTLSGVPVTCHAGSDGETTVEVTGGSPGYQFNWSIPGATDTQIDLTAGTYTVTVTDSNLCIGTDSITITEPSPIIITLDDLQNATCTGLEDGLIDVQVVGGTTTTGNEFIYDWSVNQPLSNQPQDIVTDLGAGFYFVTVMDENGCTEIAEFTVEDGYTLALVDTIIGISCEDAIDGQIQITAIENGVPNFQILLEGLLSDTLNSDGGQFDFKGLPSGEYTLSIKDQNDCAIEEVYTIPAWQDPKVSIYVDKPELYRCDSALVVANATGSNLSFQWFPAINYTCQSARCDSIKVSPENNITYSLTVKDERDCIVEDQVSLFIDEDRSLYIPNAFTPNGDGNNDIFRIRAGEHQAFLLSQISSFHVLDRWGNILFKEEAFHPFENPEIGWDGTIEGAKAPSDIYVYWAELVYCDGQREIIKGPIQLIR